ncbi:MAG: glycosyl transferase, partial [Gammaproteobacteria bacterium]
MMPLWIVTMFGRGVWTPDEPREADISWRMSVQSERAIPSLAGEPFLEKPPLTYWAAAAAES